MIHNGHGSETSNSEVRTLSALEAISNVRRRRILRYLRDGDGRAALDDLVTTLTNDDRSSRPNSADRARPDAETVEAPMNERTLRIRLHHVDLPALAEAGLVEYDRERRRVRTIAD